MTYIILFLKTGDIRFRGYEKLTYSFADST